jgi:hypothetical protein
MRPHQTKKLPHSKGNTAKETPKRQLNFKMGKRFA